MKAIILAAGQGARLRPLTDRQPKCMVPYAGKPIIDHILAALQSAGVPDTVIVTGFCPGVLHDHLRGQRVRYHHNAAYAQCNMVKSLFCAAEELDDDILISYADIIYPAGVVRALLRCPEDLAVAIDVHWRSLWERRFSNPLQDAETLKLDAEGHVVELGKRPQSYGEVQGQYMGLIKVSRPFARKMREFYDSLDRAARYDGKDFDNMYMTTFLQQLIESGHRCRSVPITEAWLEIDAPSDLQVDIGWLAA